MEEPAHVHLSTFNGKCEAEAKAKLGGMTHPAALETQTQWMLSQTVSSPRSSILPYRKWQMTESKSQRTLKFYTCLKGKIKAKTPKMKQPEEKL